MTFAITIDMSSKCDRCGKLGAMRDSGICLDCLNRSLAGKSASVIKFPATFEELEAHGYGYTGTAKLCDCGTTFLWFITPAGKWMPLSALKDSRLVPHHAVCERVKQFRAANEKHDERANGPKPKQTRLFEK